MRLKLRAHKPKTQKPKAKSQKPKTQKQKQAPQNTPQQLRKKKKCGEICPAQ
jgi:hypothetical protein